MSIHNCRFKEGINGLEEKKKDTQKKILNEEAACYFRIYENKLRHLTEENQFLYEELVHIREALDAALSYEQKKRIPAGLAFLPHLREFQSDDGAHRSRLL